MRDAIGTTGASPRAGEESHSLLELIAVLLRRRRLLVGLPLAAMVSAVLLSIFLPERHTVEARFIPESGGPDVSRLAGLAAQFGVNVPGAEGGEGVDFYAELLQSTELLRSTALTEYRFVDDGDTLSGNLVELLDVKGKTAEERVRGAVEKLDELITASVDPAAQIVTVEVSAPWPALSVDVARRVLALINEFNLDRRQSRAAAEREFLETRLEQARTELNAAERALERFYLDNRRYDESPQLTFEAGRLQRNIDLHRQIYTSLATGFEQARVDEVRNTPVITVIDQPRGPAEKTAPNVVVNAALGLILGLLLALGIVIGSELMDATRRRDPEAYARVRQSLRFGRGPSAAQ